MEPFSVEHRRNRGHADQDCGRVILSGFLTGFLLLVVILVVSEPSANTQVQLTTAASEERGREGS
eukprot:3054088-Rhodomonas_salina.1